MRGRTLALLVLALVGILTSGGCGALLPPQPVGDPLGLGSASFRLRSMSLLAAPQAADPANVDVLVAEGLVEGPDEGTGVLKPGNGSVTQLRRLLAEALGLPRSAEGSSFDDLALDDLTTPFTNLTTLIVDDPRFLSSNPDAAAIRLGTRALVDAANAPGSAPSVALREFLDEVFSPSFDLSGAGLAVPPFAYHAVPMPPLDVSQLPGLVKSMASSLRQTLTFGSLDVRGAADVGGLPERVQVVALTLELRSVDSGGKLVFSERVSVAGPWSYVRSGGGLYEADAEGAANVELVLDKADLQAYLAAAGAGEALTLYADCALLVGPELPSDAVTLHGSAGDAVLSF